MKNYHTVVGDPVEELQSTKLWNRLNEMNSTRAKEACNFVSIINPYLRDIHKHFPLYTRHDCHHSFEVLNRMGEIIKAELLEDSSISLQPLSYDEIFCLIISAYAHDVGMVVFEQGKDREKLLTRLGLSEDVADDNEKLTTFLRINHAERGIHFLRNTPASEFVPEYLRGLIGSIMKGHNMHPETLIKEIPNVAAISGSVSNPISLSIILCCADALEFSDTRVIKSAFEEAKRRNDEAAQVSVSEMMKHNSIGCGLSVSKEGLLYATGEFENAEILHGTHKTLDQIESWLKEYIYYDKLQSRQMLKLNNHNIFRDSFTLNNFKYFPVAIKMDEFQIREILTSEKMWSGEKSLPIKELLQNSIDACRYKEFIRPNAIEYIPFIEIVVNHHERTISIKDNGIGMSENDITEYFLQVGKSKTRTTSFIENPINKGFSSLARFGIGFWSVFSIAHKATVKTKFNNFHSSEYGLTFDVEVNPLMSYLEIKESDMSEGTEISLKLKEDIDISRIIDELSNTITITKIPCVIKNVEGDNLFKFNQELSNITHEDIFGYRAKEAETNGMRLFAYKESTDLFELELGITYSEINEEFRCLTPEAKPIFDYAAYNRGIGEAVVSSVCGLVTKFDLGTLPFAIERVGKLVINIKDPNGLEFSLSRRSLVHNDRFNEIQKEIIISLKKALEQFYSAINILGNAEKMQNVIDDSKSNGGNAGDSRVGELYKYYIDNYENLVPIKLLYWKLEGDKVLLEEKFMFIQEFWNLNLKVFYSCIWPERFNVQRKNNFIKSLLYSIEDREGYILWAYQEANALVEIAKSVKVINLKYAYEDWHTVRNEVIVIEPWEGFEDTNREIFSIQSRWTGQVLSMHFEGTKSNKPWYNFGRYIVYVDQSHSLVQYLIKLKSEGKMWECGEILALMASDDSSSVTELNNRTKINPLYG